MHPSEILLFIAPIALNMQSLMTGAMTRFDSAEKLDTSPVGLMTIAGHAVGLEPPRIKSVVLCSVVSLTFRVQKLPPPEQYSPLTG
jgi:hypothetical protein